MMFGLTSRELKIHKRIGTHSLEMCDNRSIPFIVLFEHRVVDYEGN